MKTIKTSYSKAGDVEILMAATGEEGIIPALPGFFLIDLMPLPSGGFDRKRILKTPVIAWKVARSGYSVPVIPGLPIADRWAVLTPDGFVIADEYTSLSGLYPLELNNWIKSEIAWVEDRRNAAYDFWTPSQKLIEYSGPLARAVWRMMNTRRNWAGRPEEMLEIISEFREDEYDNTLPAEPAALLAGLAELQSIFADAGLWVNRSDDGRLIVSRLADEGVGQGSH